MPENGLADCRRNLRNGKKRGKGRKCKFKCEKGFFLKRNKGYQDCFNEFLLNYFEKFSNMLVFVR